MEIDIFFNALTIINSIIIALFPLVFFRRQKLQEIKYKEIMELNIKTHDITQRADKSIKEREEINKKDYQRLDYLISRYKKHSKMLSDEVLEYKQLWDYVMHKGRKEELNETTRNLLEKSEKIRERADKLLN